MPWARVTIAGLVTALVAFAVGTIPWTIIKGTDGQRLPSALGISQPDATALAQPFEDLIANRNEALVDSMAEGIDRTQAREQIEQLRRLLPNAAVQSSRLVNWRVAMSGGSRQLVGVHESTFPEHVARTETVLVRSAATEPWRVQGFHMNVATKQELAANRFTLTGKPPLTLSVIAAAAVMPFLTLASFLAALFWKGLKHRWAWAIATMFGIGTFSVNVATSAWLINPFSFQLFGSSALWSGSAFDSWVFGVSLPLGALAFWTIGARSREHRADGHVEEFSQE